MTTQLNTIESRLKDKADLVISNLAPRLGQTINLKQVRTDNFTDVYGLNSGRSTQVIVTGVNAGPFLFAVGVDDTLVLNINGSGNQAIIFTTGLRTSVQVVSEINAVFPSLASTDFFKKITLKARTSIEIDAGSTALNVLGLSVGSDQNAIVLDVIVASYEFNAVDVFEAGAEEETSLYDASGIVKVGDVVEFQRTDGKKRAFKVISEETIGQSLVILTRFLISPIEE